MTTAIERAIEMIAHNMSLCDDSPSTQQNKEKAMTQHVDALNININSKKSVEYAKTRNAINMDANELYKDNAAGHYTFRKARKKIVIKFLGGSVARDLDEKSPGYKKLFVNFPDGSKARY